MNKRQQSILFTAKAALLLPLLLVVCISPLTYASKDKHRERPIPANLIPLKQSASTTEASTTAAAAAAAVVASNETLESIQAEIEAALTAAQESLSQHPSTIRSIQEMMAKEESQTNAQLNQLKKQQEKLHKVADEIEQGIIAYNVNQLYGLYENLHALEENRKAQFEQAQATVESLKDEAAAKQEQETVVVDVDGVLIDELHEALNITSIREDREGEIQQYMYEYMENKLDELPPLPSIAVEKPALSTEGSSCVTIGEAALEVQKALQRHTQDGIGLDDHLQAGSSIVHELTSDTYQPPPLRHETLGAVWWRKYIPDDIEAWLLPSNWMQWDIRIPYSIRHILGMHYSGASAPPETILQADTIPGSCWPMRGSSGNVAFTLPYPVYVNSISIDHAHRKLLSDPSKQMRSAPRHISVIGYPPCSNVTHQASCGGYPFDVSEPVTLLEEVVYDIKGKQTQTFVLSEYYNEDEASCAVNSASCSALPFPPGSITIAAVKMMVADNWGHPDYTCLYRVRVHGEKKA
jgi:Sad1 / UNC-like C-terminal